MKSTTLAGLTLASGMLLAYACGGGSTQGPTPVPQPTATPNLPAIMTAGDISCDSATPQLACKSRETSDLIVSERALRPAVLTLPLGDLQYDSGTLAEFRRNYHATWGRLNPISRPAPGNHEYETRNASGYFDYFVGEGVNVGLRTEGWYSYDFAEWHFVALNSNCDRIGGCQAGSPQYQWLQADLALSRRKCTVAYMHHPLVSTGLNGNAPTVLPLMRLLYTNRTEIVLTGHDHNYERFVPMTPDLVPDAVTGLRLFVVGTGGRDLQSFARATIHIVAFRTNEHFGVLRIVMRGESYDWSFVNIGGTVIDAGTGECF